MGLPAFRFKKFEVNHEGAAHPVGTDGVLLGAWADLNEVYNFLDIGTGTGLVALMLAQRLSDTAAWSGAGVELHPASADLARHNFASSPWAKNLEVMEGPIQIFAELNEVVKSFDLIVSNPPFFSELTISTDQNRNIGRHTASLSPGDLLSAVQKLLAPGGRFCVILPEMEGRRFCSLAVPNGLYWTRITGIRSRPGKPIERLLIQFEKNPYPFQQDEIHLFAAAKGDEPSEAFSQLTGEFYLAR